MTKPLRIVDAVAEHDIPAIVDYHRLRSNAKAERIVAEYDRIIELLAVNPYVLACFIIGNSKRTGWLPAYSTLCAIPIGFCPKR